MARIRCRSCGKGYSYQGDCCPNCGAFNRKPKRGYIGADGDYHAVDEKVCFEKKVCYEDQAEKVWKESPDRKPERRSGAVKRPNTTRFTSREADQVIDRFTRSANASAKKFASQFLDSEDGAAAAEAAERFARNFREKTAQFTSKSTDTFKRRGEGYAPRRHSSSGKGAVLGMGLGILFVIIAVVFNMVSNADIVRELSIFDAERETAVPQPDTSIQEAVPLDAFYYDYGGVFRLDDGDEFTAFTTDAYAGMDGEVVVSAFCDGEWSRFDPVIIDELTGALYTRTRSVEWQENNYQLFYHVADHDPDNYHYSFYYTDTYWDEMYLIAELSSDGASVNDTGAFRDIPLLDGETLYTSALMDYADGLLTVHVLCDYENLHERFIPYLQDESNGDLYDPLEFVHYGTGEYEYLFDVGVADFDRAFTFCYLDGDYDAMLTVASYEVRWEDNVAVAMQEFVHIEHRDPAVTQDGVVLTAFVTDTYIYEEGTVEIVCYSDGDPSRFAARLWDENSGIIYDPVEIVQRDGDYTIRFYVDDHDAADFYYSFVYEDVLYEDTFLVSSFTPRI